MPTVLAEAGFRPEAALTFLLYLVGVFVLAIFSHRLLAKRSFLQEYFLGSRGLGIWALAMSYAATSASGGSFTGFPALIYRHGWVLALWIASYMIVPICCMGILGKRLNQVARKSGAITIPDVFRDRFRAPRLGVASSLILAFFLAFNLVAQFKAGALIVDRLFGEMELYAAAAQSVAWIPETFSFLSSRPPTPGYCLGLLLFSGAVVAYTTYGGFRAVVWTDVLQGIVMFFGVLILLVFALRAAGGLEPATKALISARPTAVELRATEDLDLEAGSLHLEIATPKGPLLVRSSTPIRLQVGESRTYTFHAEDASGPTSRAAIRVQDVRIVGDAPAPPVEILAARHDALRNLVSAPGYHPEDAEGFLPIGLAFSFFVFWAIAGAGQPTTMVRLMAFENTKVYRRAMFSVSVYYTLIYVPLIVVFICARTVLPSLEQPDAAMPAMVIAVVPPLLAGIIMAAPFAAVMSTVDSFLLAISSSLVRDVYQRSIHPEVSEKGIRRLSYGTTLVVGVVVMAGAINPPEFLQTIIVLTGAGLSCTFLAPMFLSLYWKRMTAAGCFAGLFGGFATCFGLYVLGWIGVIGDPGALEPHPGGFLPVIWGLAASTGLCIVVSLATPPPDEELVDFWFHRP